MKPKQIKIDPAGEVLHFFLTIRWQFGCEMGFYIHNIIVFHHILTTQTNKKPLTADKQSLSLRKHSSSPGYINPWTASGAAKNESGEQISSLTLNFSGIGTGGPCSRESFRHLKSFQGSCGSRFCCCCSEEDSTRALRFASAARRFASARCRCSSVISIA
jgi:hypothetical protein